MKILKIIQIFVLFVVVGCGASNQDASLVSIANEPAGMNCADGGVRVDSGIDDDGSGTLEQAEVDATEYVCNGSSGTQTLVATTTLMPGPTCGAGGVVIDYGADDDGNGTLEQSEIDGTETVCNYANVPVGTVRCYSFEGDASDLSTNAANGTAMGGATYATGKMGQAVSLDGTDDYVSLPTLLVEDITVAGWVYYDIEPGTWARFFEHSIDVDFPTNGTIFASFKDLSGTPATFARIWDSASPAATTAPNIPTLAAGQWHHVVMTYDQAGSGLALYINGVLVGSDPYNATGIDDWGASQVFNIGKSSWSADDDVYIEALFDEVFVYDRALAEDEVNALYNGGNGPSCAGLP